MTDWLLWLMNQLGAPGVGLAIALESIFPPIPSELVLPLAGFTVSRGDLSLVSVLIWTTVGSLAGALTLYGLGAALGAERLRSVARRIPLMDAGDIDRSDAWFDRHGSKAVFFGRMVPGVRSLVSIPAGVTGMPMTIFVLFTVAGSAIWNTALVLAGFALGEHWDRVEAYVGWIQKVVVAAILVWLVVFVVRRVRRRRADRTRASDKRQETA